MTASSIALSLLNCNPLITSDPILTSSLTSLATQVLHMEHLIQLYMVSLLSKLAVLIFVLISN